ncbi:hypothetical protein HZH68_001343 [Vespula germanica]|uniref:Uncharacterized protein n=1 Tax=Vespula germanica TaxID=30212 RepID=A0A834NVA4_VESGE|nr:hypothetical protein HZH68_001343 [Vespula germanica]
MSFSLTRPELLALPLNIHRTSVMGEPANWETRQNKFETRDSRDAGGPLVLPRARCLVLVRSWPAGGMRRYAAAETLTGLFAGITSFASRGKENRRAGIRRAIFGATLKIRQRVEEEEEEEEEKEEVGKEEAGVKAKAEEGEGEEEEEEEIRMVPP